MRCTKLVHGTATSCSLNDPKPVSYRSELCSITNKGSIISCASSLCSTSSVVMEGASQSTTNNQMALIDSGSVKNVLPVSTVEQPSYPPGSKHDGHTIFLLADYDNAHRNFSRGRESKVHSSHTMLQYVPQHILLIVSIFENKKQSKIY
ncbi:hypothetical protein TNCV_1667081 [Trichonephila clavipes]|nr:hypothetical protein TNCV_1667081 [Trichonephila clavipes]